MSLLFHIQGGSAEIIVKAGDSLTLSTDKIYSDCGDNNTLYVDYVNITKVLNYNNSPLYCVIFLYLFTRL